MKAPRFGLSAFALAILLLAPPVSAQYIFLDSNGDGVHTAADELHAVGPTVVDIWLDTGHNRDGSATVCNADPATPVTMFSYEVTLEATGGTVSYSAFTNRIPQMGLLYPALAPDGAHFDTGPYATPGATLPPSKYLLGTFTVSVVSGAPSIRPVPEFFWNGSWALTMFGSSCDASVYLNTMTLGYDWFDVDGLQFGPGGVPNHAPAFSLPAAMTVFAGDNAVQAISAEDIDGQPLAFAKVSGPSFMHVATTDVGTGTAQGEIRLAPFATDIGTAGGSVSVTDGTATTEQAFPINVTATSNHLPGLGPTPKLVVVAGETGRLFLSANDPDGEVMHIAKASGPRYARITELAARAGGASASLTVSPTFCDVGSTTAIVSLSDGVSTSLRDVELSVVPPPAPPDSLPLLIPETGGPMGIGLRDLNGDGNLDVVVTHQYQPTISVLLGRGDGSLGAATSYATATRSLALAMGDLNRDGNLDVAVANSMGSGVSVFLGKGDGTLFPAVQYETGPEPSEISAVDLSRDGILDLVTCNTQGSTVSILLGQGDGSFSKRPDAPAGPHPRWIAVGDFNLDGRIDVAVTNFAGSHGSSLTILPGLGDGNFVDGLVTPIPVSGAPYSLTSADWNWDGALDLAFTDLYTANVRSFSGSGDGHLAPSATATLHEPYTCTSGDLNGDGNADLVVTDLFLDGISVLFGNGSGGFSSPVSFGGLEMGAGSVAVGDMNSDGRPDMVVAGENSLGVFLNRFGSGARSAEARAFVQNGHRAIPAAAGSSTLCIRLEPIQGSYTNDQLDLTSLTLTSEGTGSVSEIHCVSARKNVEADTDGNGIAEIGSFFSRRDLAALFDQVQGRSTMTAQLTGSLTDGRMFCAGVELEIVGTSHAPHASFAPNPLNPQTKLTFTTARTGPAKARIFDIQGRLVRTLLDVPHLAPGKHEYAFDGRSARGAQLASGVYFFRVESTEETIEGHLVILK